MINDEIRASQAVIKLCKDGLDFYAITRAFSLGFLGLRSNRKAVPTRWAITAIDKIIGDYLLSSLKTKPSISDILVFYEEYIYNKYIIVLSPGTFRAMWVEVWHPTSIFNPSSEVEIFIAEEQVYRSTYISSVNSQK